MQNQQYQQPGYPQNQQLQYNAPPNQQPPYGAPLNQYGGPPQQQAYGAPPNQYQQQQQGWNQPPPNQYPQQGYSPGPPPPGQPQYGAPPNQYGAPPNQFNGPPQPYGAPGQPQFGASGQAPFGEPSPGYGHVRTAQIDVSQDIKDLDDAMKRWGTNEEKIIRVLSKADPLRVNTIRMLYEQQKGKLIDHLMKETSGYFEKGLVQIARGPLATDAHNLNGAMKGLGTKEDVLNDVLIGRSNADIKAIKDEYQTLFKRSLEADLRGDLSAATETMFVMIIAAQRQEETAPVIPQQIDQDVNELQRAMGNMINKDATQTCQILTSRSDAQLRAITQTYEQKYRMSLDSVIKSKFSGHMEDALRLIIARANNRALSDAVQLEDAMAGVGTKDELLVQRVVRAHWNRQHMQRVNTEYKNKYRKDLYRRIEGETRGDYKKLMVACVNV
ncbi:hypothetical protein BDV96DRAFT_495401 [Lophiotrema nucula]|uniref:Annexin n=1 Tax=Lophiotrema nucula TaxID=690887 RepID=A0A6A5Z3Z0_9PLEO|nr:hypothetical protein BDV96DRAFT_495401 [Lophiotrema nucula]